jgi:hypothetical protein
MEAYPIAYVDLTASPPRPPTARAEDPADIMAERLARKRARDREYQRVRRARARETRARLQLEAEAAAEIEDFENYIDEAVAAAEVAGAIAAAEAAAAAIAAEGDSMDARPIDELFWPIYEKPSPSPSDEEEPARKGGAIECAICLGGGGKWSSLACGHVFCDGCVRKSLMFKPACPTCRAPARLSHVRRVFI